LQRQGSTSCGKGNMGATCCLHEQNSQTAAVLPDAQEIEVQDEPTKPVGEPPGLKMVFRMSTSPDSDQKTVNFTKSPVGLNFTSGKVPIFVRGVEQDGEAVNLGVQPGMMIEKIGEADITKDTYEAALSLIKEKVGELPKA